MHRLNLSIILSITILFVAGLLSAQPLMQYGDPQQAGFDAQRLEQVKTTFEQSDAAALLLLYRGHVVLSLGETTRKFRCASMRKSLMNVMIGHTVDAGQIDISATLARLGIDDEPALSEAEKEATVEQLLQARSGIYHLAAYMPRGMEKQMPRRGSHAPGTFWFYNNWDFNTLVSIYNRQTGSDFFEDFYAHVAKPLGMEDFELGDTFYRYEEDKSQHPAYLMRMSARDLARFGQLCLNGGTWQGRQIVSSAWLEKSTLAHSTNLRAHDHKGNYGYLWWVADSIFGQKTFYASGAGGQRVFVLPEEEMVVVHLVDTYDNNDVNDQQAFSLLQMIINAKTARAQADARLLTYQAPQSDLPAFADIEPAVLAKYLGSYKHKFLGEMTISREKGQLSLETGIGHFRIHPLSETSFYAEDMEYPLEFVPAAEESQKGVIKSVYNENRKIDKIIFYY